VTAAFGFLNVIQVAPFFFFLICNNVCIELRLENSNFIESFMSRG